jgi:glutamine synthetase
LKEYRGNNGDLYMSVHLGNVKWVEVHYTDLMGRLRSISTSFTEDLVVGIDGSSIGVENVESSDVLVIGDLETLRKLPWSIDWGRVIGDIHKSRQVVHPLDSRSVAKRVEEYTVRELGLTPLVGVELEFFVFRDIVVNYDPPFTHTYVVSPLDRSIRGVSNCYQSLNNVLESYRGELAKTLIESFYINVNSHHHEVASSQLELSLNPSKPLVLADSVQTAKYVARKIAEFKGLKTSFAPKPLPGENGSGMHIHISLWRNSQNLFYDPSDKHGVSQVARYFIGGILQHVRALSALVAPSVNSYRRLVPGYEAPVYAYWGYKNRSTCIRVPFALSENAARIEFRVPDPTANPYIALTAVILAGLDGVKKSIDPGDPLDTSAYRFTKVPREKRLPASLLEAIEELESDQDFLKPLIPQELLETYIEAKKKEYVEVSQHPSVMEVLIYS